MGLKWSGQKAIDYVAQHGGWLRVEGKGMVSLADARKADPSKVTGGPRTKPAKKPAAAKKPKAEKKPKTSKPKAAKKPKAEKAKPAKKPKAPKKAKTAKKGKTPAAKRSGIVGKIKRLVNQL